MKITFPHMGEAYIIIKSFCEDIGLEVVVPPPCSRETLHLGMLYSPEYVCMPFKINIGNYLESIKHGADTIIITGSCGPCRFGLYWLLQKEILHDLGYEVMIIPFDPPGENLKRFMENIHRLCSGNKPYNLLHACVGASKVARQVDNLYKTLYYIRPREKSRGTSERIMNTFSKRLATTHGSAATLKLIRETVELLKSIPIAEQQPVIRIGIIGEMYTMIEPLVNLNLEKKLGLMGVEVDRSITVCKWMETNLFWKALRIDKEKSIKASASPYLSTFIGGHTVECLGHAVQYAQKGYDGLIHIYPFTCMPQIIGKGILPKIERDYGVPILKLVVDELTGESGYLTRLEAFIDFLRKRKIYKEMF